MTSAENLDDALAKVVRQSTEDVQSVTDLLRRGAQPSSESDKVPLLVWAAKQGHVRTMKELLDAGADANAASGAALFGAVTSGATDVVDALLDGGADVRIKGAEDRTPLHEAAKSANAKIVRQLIEAGAKVDSADGQHRTPLMDAAASGGSDSIQLLLDAGADPLAKDADGKTPSEVARLAKQDKAAAALDQFQKIHGDSPENAVRPKAGEDLAKIVQGAQDGQVVILPPGKYAGMLAVAGKSLIIRGASRDQTILTGSDQAAVFVGEKARVELENLSIRADAKTKLGVYVQGGEAQIRNCSFSGMSGNGCVANGGRLAIQRCDFVEAGKLAVYGAGGTAVTIRESTFAKQAGAAFQGAESVGIFDCRFSDNAVAVQSRGQNASICVRNNSAQVSRDSVAETAALDLEAGRRCIITGNRFSNFSQTVSITGTAVSPSIVARNYILNPKGGMYVSATNDGKRPSALLIDNVIADAANYGVLVEKGAQIKASGSLIMSSDGVGVVLQAKSSAILAHNDIYAPKEAIGLRETDASALDLNANRIVGPIAAGSTGVKLDDATKRFSAASKGGSSDALKKAAEKFIASLPAAADNEGAVSVARGDFSRALDGVAKEGAQFAQVSLHIIDSTGQQFFPDFEVYPDRDGGFDQKYLLTEDIIDSSSLLQKIRSASDPVSQYLRDQLPKDLLEQLKAADLKSPSSEIVEAVRQSLNELLKRNALYEKERFAKIRLAPLTVNAVSMLPSDPKASNRTVLTANRYLLEDAFPAEIASSRSLATQTANDRWASVSPGKYWLVPKSYPRFAKQVAVQAGESLDAESAQDNAIVLGFRETADGPLTKILLSLKPADKMRESIAKVRRYDHLRSLIALPRPGFTKEEAAGALSLARENLQKCSGPAEEDKKGLNNDQVDELKGKLAAGLWNAERIFAVAGEAKDSELISKALLTADYQVAAAEVIAYMECRLGVLPHGYLVAALSGKDSNWAIEAATQLHSYGLKDGDQKLIDYVHSVPTDDLYTLQLAAFALLDISDSAALDAMRAFVAQAKKNEKLKSQWLLPWSNPSVPAVVYLLAYGNKDDWREVSKQEMGAYHAAYLAYLLDDPTPLATWLAKVGHIRNIATMSPALRANPPQCENLAKEFENAVYVQTFRESTGDKQHDANYSLEEYQVETSFWRPQAVIAQYYLDKKHTGIYMEDVTWLPSQATTEVAQRVAQNSIPAYAFEYFPHEEFVKDVRSPTSAKDTFLSKLKEASHGITYRGFYSDWDNFRDGIERRPFVLQSSNDDGSCATSGVLEVQPVLNERKFRVALRFRQRQALQGIGFFPPANLKSKTAIEDGGKSLIDGIRLRRGDHVFKTTDVTADDKGQLSFEADLDQSDLTGIYLEIDLRFKDEPVKAQLVYDLFASDYARELQLKKGQKGTAKAGDVPQGGL